MDRTANMATSWIIGTCRTSVSKKRQPRARSRRASIRSRPCTRSLASRSISWSSSTPTCKPRLAHTLGTGVHLCNQGHRFLIPE